MARVSALDLDRVERTMQALLSRDPLVVTYHDRSTDDVLSVSPEAAASRTGLLPAFLAAGQVVWRDLTGAGSDLDVVRDPAALFGFSVCAASVRPSYDSDAGDHGGNGAGITSGGDRRQRLQFDLVGGDTEPGDADIAQRGVAA